MKRYLFNYRSKEQKKDSQKKKCNDKKKMSSFSLNHLLQAFIYTMNRENVRNAIIRQSIRNHPPRQPVSWMGTWTVMQSSTKELYMTNSTLSLDRYLQSRSFDPKKVYFFTVCLVYDTNSVHYVAFVFYPSLKRLLSFDPGFELYHHGQETIVPLIRECFYRLNYITPVSKQNIRQYNIGNCHDFSFCGKKWGLQYNADHTSSLPADAFCQTWTLFFLSRLLLQENILDVSFVKNWCQIHPFKRELFVLLFFILPHLSSTPVLKREYKKELDLSSPQEYKRVMYTLVHYSEIFYSKKKREIVQCPLSKN